MAKRRIIPIRVNVQTSLEVDENGRQVSSPTRLFRGDQALLRLTLVDTTGEAYPLDAGMTFRAGLDSVFTPDHADLASALHAAFNVSGDWANANPTAGKLACRLSLSTTELKSDLSSTASKDMYLCLWATPPGEEAMLVFQIRVTVQNVAVEPSGTTATEEETYLTADTLGAVIEQFTEGGVQKVRIKNAAGATVAVFGE